MDDYYADMDTSNSEIVTQSSQVALLKRLFVVVRADRVVTCSAISLSITSNKRRICCGFEENGRRGGL
jgi:hypothetical protein